MYDDYEFDGRESGLSTIVGVVILCALILGGAVGLIWYLQGPFVGRKFVGALVAPLGIFWIATFVAAMSASFTRQKFLALLLWVMMLSLSILGNRSVANNLISGLETPQREHASVPEGVVYDYGFVLGGGLAMNRFDGLDFNESGERVTDAIRYYKQGKIKHLVFTGSPFLYTEDEAKANAAEAGDNRDRQATKPFTLDTDDTTPTEPLKETEEANPAEDEPGAGPWSQDLQAELDGTAPADPAASRSSYENAMREMLKGMGVAESDVTFLGGRYTAEEMVRIDEFLKDKSDTQNAMITSAWHMQRAAKLRNAQGLTMKSLPVDFRTEPNQDDPIFFVPQLGPFANSSAAIKEYLAGWVQ